MKECDFVNKSKVIKSYLGIIFFENGFSYKSAPNMWIFERESPNDNGENIKQLIYVQKNNYGNELYFRLQTNAYGQILTDIPNAVYSKNINYKYNSDEEFEKIIIEFTAIMKKGGFDLLKKMCEPIVIDRPTIEQSRYMIRNIKQFVYKFITEKSVDLFCDKSHLLNVISTSLKPLKNKNYTENATSLMELASYYGEWMNNVHSGSWYFDEKHGICVKYEFNKFILTVYVLDRMFLCWQRMNNFNEKDFNELLPKLLHLD